MISCLHTKQKYRGEDDPIIEINDTIKDKYCALNDFFDTKIKDHSKKIVVMVLK
jgi:hypothetical protein